MTEIRLGPEDGYAPASLGDVPFNNVDDVIRRLQRWGVKHENNFVDTDTLFGQFTVKDGLAYFEVLFPND